MNGPRIFDRDDDHFTPKLRSGRSDEQIAHMHRNMRKHPRLPKPLNQLGARGVYVPMLPAGSRAAIVKTTWVTPSSKASLSSKTQGHMSYLTQEGTNHDGGRAELLGHKDEVIDRKGFATRADEAPHQYRLVISLLDANKLEMTTFVQRYMKQMEQDVGTRLDHVFAIHHDTKFTHAHVAINCGLDHGQTLYLKKGYYLGGMARRASELATIHLGREHAIEQHQHIAQVQQLEYFTSHHLKDDTDGRKGRAMDEQGRIAWLTRDDHELQRAWTELDAMHSQQTRQEGYDWQYTGTKVEYGAAMHGFSHSTDRGMTRVLIPVEAQEISRIFPDNLSLDAERPTLIEAARDVTKTAMFKAKSIAHQYTAHPIDAAKDLVQSFNDRRQERAEIRGLSQRQTMAERLEKMVAQVKDWAKSHGKDQGVER